VSASGAAVVRGVRLFNRGRYLAAQEVWETAWRTADAAERPLLEGLGAALAVGLGLRSDVLERRQEELVRHDRVSP
jgi:predicted metal-dependent hydrolase